MHLVVPFTLSFRPTDLFQDKRNHISNILLSLLRVLLCVALYYLLPFTLKTENKELNSLSSFQKTLV